MRRASLIENSSWNVGAFIAYIALGVLSAPVYLRFLGLKQYGIYVLLNTVIAPLGVLNMGMGQAAVKYISGSLARNRPEEANAYLQSTFLSTAAIGAVGVLVVIAAARVLTKRIFAISQADQQIVSAGVPWVALSWLLTQLSLQFTAVPTALQRYSIVSTGSTLCSATTLGLGLLALALGGSLLTVLQVRAAWVGVTMLGWCFVAKYLVPSLGLRLRVTRATFATCMHFGIWQTVAAVGGVIGGNVDQAMLGMYVSSQAVGLFAIPQNIVNIAYALTTKSAEVLLPAVSELDCRAGRDQAISLTLRVSWLLSALTSATLGCLVVFGRDVLRLYVGTAIAASCGDLMMLIAVTAIASSGSVAVYQYLLGTGNTRWAAMMTLVSGVICFLGGIALIPRLGLNGAAWSNLVSIVLVRPIMHLHIWRHDARTTGAASFLTYLYGPAVIGIPLSLALRAVRNATAWNAGIFGVVIGAACCFLIIGGAVVLFDLVLPDSIRRQTDLRQGLRQISRIPRQAVAALALLVGKLGQL
jgi:O-antigen/teichoic acid export membrane protein